VYTSQFLANKPAVLRLHPCHSKLETKLSLCDAHKDEAIQYEGWVQGEAKFLASSKIGL